MEPSPLFASLGQCCSSFGVAETEYAGHARDLGASLDLDTVDGLVTCGGDGILWELVNGLSCAPFLTCEEFLVLPRTSCHFFFS